MVKLQVPVLKSLENEFSLKLADGLFSNPTDISKSEKLKQKSKCVFHFASTSKKQCFINIVVRMFYNFQEGKPSEYNSSSGTKIFKCLKEVEGVRL